MGLVSLPLAGLLNVITSIFAGALISLAEFGSSLPLLTWGEISWLGYSLYFIGASAFILTALGHLKFKRALFVALAAASFSVVSALGNFSPEIVFLDVGQGDSTLIRLENRKEILIDGGGSPFSDFDVGKGIIAPALRGFGVDELELVLASHVDADHIEGLISLLDEIPVQQLVIGASKVGDPLFDALMESAKRNNVQVVQVFKGQSITMDNARLDFLNPPHNFYEKDNDNSLTFVLNYKDIPKAVFMGDLPIEIEKNLAFPKVDILMAGHHGSKSSTSAQILAATQPKDIVISYGRNSYGHPNDGLMKRLAATGARIHETFKEGQIRISLE
ncbi:MAG TPA: MBL fold metallo-hydrolase [Trueperaceae bacterium]|nr:MBL fold metallo-hydrolase [Trueperaceae bacterium]